MQKIDGQAKSQIVSPDVEKAQQAILHFKVAARSEKQTWLQIQLETGRTHQIRLQASHHGYPILGDELYNATTEFGPTTHDIRKKWIALHARELGFVHPISKEDLEVTAPLPVHWDVLPFDF